MSAQDPGPGADESPQFDVPESASGAHSWVSPDRSSTELAAPPDEVRAEGSAPAVEYAYAPPFGHGHGPAPRRTNRFAIVALVTGLLGMLLLAIGFAIAAFVQIGRRGEKGKGLAIGGLAASAAWVVGVVAVVAATTLSAGGSGDASAAASTKNGKPRVTTLGVGACFLDYEEDLDRIYATIGGCTLPHEGEVGAQFAMPAAPYPGDTELVSTATKVCKEKTEDLVDNRYRDHIELRLDRPRRSDWDDGDRHIICVLHYTGKEELTSPLKYLQWGPRSASDLVTGDCIVTWRTTGIESLVDCKKEHKYQVFATYNLHGDDYPSGLEAKATQGCTKRADKVFKSHFPGGVEIWYTYPSKKGWNYGDRRIMCLVHGVDGPLRRSLMPR
ncbi:septum formation family protein [Actinomadura opuntiae]|uniref:septum formation family protein n=1 Tax=Actinomadura sp. OS1-43 TaxID=604315 RepID=UPI00255AA1A1|nr:septum formation family protein [Actinomadura sp. OS1-43]MDL4818023.1 septum formation family protein [Actinomadura sp. OS1-43]